MNKFTLFTLGLSVLFSNPLWAAKTTFSFDTVTNIEYATPNISSLPINTTTLTLTGVEKDSGDPLTLALREIKSASGGSFDNQLVFQRCAPLILMAMDKPGKYFLHIDREDFETLNNYVYACRLEHKN